MRFVISSRPAWLITGLLLALTGCGSPSAPADGSPQPAAPSSEESTSIPAEPPAATAAAPSADTRPRVTLDTSMGQIVVELDREKAPITVENFLGYVDAGEYNETVFHQVWKDYVVVAGTYDSQLAPKEARTGIFNEADNGLRNARGTIAMSRLPEAAHSATRQFFFNLADNPVLDHHGREDDADYGYCVFGKVVEGLEVLDRIAGVPVHDTPELEQLPEKTVMIHTARRVR